MAVPPTTWAVEYGDNYQSVTYNVAGKATCSSKGGLTPFLSALFMPVGFPSSVRQEYVEYQLWDTVQALSSYLRGIFSTRALLASAGVGDKNASPLAAAVTWVLRDGAAMIGSLALGYGAGSSFDSRLKEWRLFADIINDVGLTLNMVTPLIDKEDRPHLFFGVMAVASVCTAMCGVAAGSTKSSITAHMAMNGNTADVSAKENAQETFVTLIGILSGIAVARWLNELESSASFTWSWMLFVMLTLLHVYANWRCVTALKLRSLNRHRVNLLLEAWKKKKIFQGCNASSEGHSSSSSPSPSLPSVQISSPSQSLHPMSLAAVAEAEARFMSWFGLPWRVMEDLRITLGAPLSMLIQAIVNCGGKGAPEVNVLRSNIFHRERFLLHPLPMVQRKASILARHPKVQRHAKDPFLGIVCVFLQGASAMDELKAYLTSRAFLDRLDQANRQDACTKVRIAKQQNLEVLSLALKDVNAFWLDFLAQLRHCGGDSHEFAWDLERLSLGSGVWRCDFTNPDERKLE